MSNKKPPTNKPNGAASNEDEDAPVRRHKRRSSEERLAELQRKGDEIKLKALLEGETTAHQGLRETFNDNRLLRRAADTLDELDEHELADKLREVADALWSDIARDAKKLDPSIQLGA